MVLAVNPNLIHAGRARLFFWCYLWTRNYTVLLYCMMCVHCVCVFLCMYLCGYLYRTGASIIRNAKSIVPLVFEKTFYNPLCFIQFENPTIPPTEIKQVNKYTVHIFSIRMGSLLIIMYVHGITCCYRYPQTLQQTEPL